MQTQVVVQLATTVVASLLGLALAGRVLRPLRSLAATAQRISDTDLTQRIEVRARDEASQIADAFNDMLARLEASFTTQRQFLDDTSHELRTPLTVIRGHIELMEFDESPVERAGTIALVTDEIDRMNQIVSDLFVLARADRPGFCTFEPMDLQDLILTAHQKMSALAPRDWQIRVPPEVLITADRNRLTQALLQLADNAVKHAGDDATIQVGADVDNDGVRLWLADSGPGVSENEVEEIFARFKRGGKRSGRSSGAGLGLSIVSAIAQAHGGSVALVPQRGGGAHFEMTIPRDHRGSALPWSITRVAP
ncbi:HAMP domain-containing sensor histidine kinase [Arthrobacter sp. H5]|uniref:sensor histidine kinase n=1 Tax=Arthrobacter sp. H5 TaxID=1267973 RepID=UPI0004B16F6B|nr:HAMP domain-containing sensor histidine kinase [Arthrobacter sp. H5]